MLGFKAPELEVRQLWATRAEVSHPTIANFVGHPPVLATKSSGHRPVRMQLPLLGRIPMQRATRMFLQLPRGAPNRHWCIPGRSIVCR